MPRRRGLLVRCKKFASASAGNLSAVDNPALQRTYTLTTADRRHTVTRYVPAGVDGGSVMPVYESHAGKVLFQCIEPYFSIRFHEDDWLSFTEEDLSTRYSLVILNLISGACGVPMPDPVAESLVLGYLRSGGSLFLLHGASAAFWQWDWWRAVVGCRWVRKDDPDGFAPSSHPTVPFTVAVAKCRHPLCRQLREVQIPRDEMYIGLEQTQPTVTLMETRTDEGTFPMCYEATTTWGGKIAGYIPGHAPGVVQLPGNVANCRTIIDYLLSARSILSSHCAHSGLTGKEFHEHERPEASYAPRQSAETFGA